MQAIADDLAIAQWIETQNSLPKLFLFYGATVRCLSLVSRSLDSSRSSNLQFRKSGSVVNWILLPVSGFFKWSLIQAPGNSPPFHVLYMVFPLKLSNLKHDGMVRRIIGITVVSHSLFTIHLFSHIYFLELPDRMFCGEAWSDCWFRLFCCSLRQFRLNRQNSQLLWSCNRLMSFCRLAPSGSCYYFCHLFVNLY